jgi:hypothetical protein
MRTVLEKEEKGGVMQWDWDGEVEEEDDDDDEEGKRVDGGEAAGV